MDLLTQFFYLRCAALDWLQANPTSLNASKVREALIASINFRDSLEPKKD